MKLFWIVTIFLSVSFVGCGPKKPKPEPLPKNVIVKEAPPPEGTEKICWQEPKVVEEKNGPGLDENKHWYNPSYTAVREVKMGRWVDCNKVK